jgi:hypothetical protein
MLEEVCAGNAAALALVLATSDNGMAVTAACRQLELMRQTVAEESAGPRQSLPGLIIENRDGSVRTIAPPMPPPMQIEHESFPERLPELEPPGR